MSHREDQPDNVDDREWRRCFIASEPRLSEAVETYSEIGFEVELRAVASGDAECTTCMLQDPDAYKVIFVRRAADRSPADGDA